MIKFNGSLALVVCLLISPALAQQVRVRGQLTELEESYVSGLGQSYGDPERSRAADWTLANGVVYAEGVQVRFSGFQIDRMRFNTAEEAAQFAADLPASDFVEVRGNQVLRVFGPRRPDDAELTQAWNGLPSPQSAPRDTQSAPRETQSAPREAQPHQNGAVQLLRHHLLEEELPASAPSADPEGEPADEEPAANPLADLDPADAIAAARAEPAVDEILGEHMSDRAQAAFDAMTPEEQDAFAGLLAQHSDPAEQAYLLRALAAGNELADLEWFSDEIQGRGGQWLDDNARLVGGSALTQQFGHSCVPTTAQALRGELDPIYALRMRLDGDVHSVDPSNPYAHNLETAVEQQTLLFREGGLPVARDQSGGLGTPWAGYEGLADEVGSAIGVDYELVRTAGKDNALAAEILDANLEAGVPTPLGIFGPSSAHAVLAVDRRELGNGGVEYQIYDPWYGTLTWVDRADVIADTINVGTGQPDVGYVMRYRETGPDGEWDAGE